MTAKTARIEVTMTSEGGERPPSMLKALSATAGLPPPDEGYLTATDGARLRYACWRTAATRQGAILYLNGRTEFIEKTMDVYAMLSGSGFDIWTFDWRGQGRSARALADTEKGHVTDYQHYLDDLHQFVSEVTDLAEPAGKTIMLGHSMGGHLGFRYLHDHQGLFDAAVFSAPMIDIAVNKAPLRALNAAITGLGLGERYALGMGPFRFVYQNPDDAADNGQVEIYQKRLEQFRFLTHDAAKFMEIQRLIRADPALALGGPTAAWLAATFRSINLTWAPGYAETIETPVLIVGGGLDKVVVTARQKAMAKRLPNGRFDVIDQAAHELLVECDDVRHAFLQQAAAFAEISIDQPPIDMNGCARR